jgi:hypothetical protein
MSNRAINDLNLQQHLYLSQYVYLNENPAGDATGKWITGTYHVNFHRPEQLARLVYHNYAKIITER